MRVKKFKFKLILLIIASLFLCACEAASGTTSTEFRTVKQIFIENYLESVQATKPMEDEPSNETDLDTEDDLPEIDESVLENTDKQLQQGMSVLQNAEIKQEVLNKIEELRELYPDGKYWNHGGVSDTPCDHEAHWTRYCNSYASAVDVSVSENDVNFVAIECKAFAGMLSDYIFGADAPVATFTNFDEIRVGDLLRIDYSEIDGHSAVIIEKGDDYVKVAECNADFLTCRISWDRVIKRIYLDKWEAFYITRYSDIPEDATVWDTTGYVHKNDISANEK